jgi:5-methyltetrahydrofolate--homocysteine methyltransferase
MLIIGEKLNSSIPSALATLSGDESEVIRLIKAQSEAGADYLDINTAMLGETEYLKMKETVKLALANSDKGIMPDSVNMEIIRDILPLIGKRPTIINSISLSADVTPLKGLDLSDIGVIAMPTDEDGVPETPEKRIININVLLERLLKLGFKEKNIYADILIETTAVNQEAAVIALETLKLIKKKLPNINTVCGATNISFGLPKRKYINSAFVALAAYTGIDAMIIDITNPDIKGAALAAELLAGRDEYCMNYIDSMR